MLLSRNRQQRRDEKGFEGKSADGVYVDIPPAFSVANAFLMECVTYMDDMTRMIIMTNSVCEISLHPAFHLTNSLDMAIFSSTGLSETQ